MHETPVGFKYICEIMRNETVLIGGEETGGIGFKDFIPERDGILSGLLILELMAYRKKGILEILKDVEREYGSFVYQRLDSIFHDGRKKKVIISRLKENPPKDILGKSIKEIKTIDGIKFICEDMSWLMIRPSGTEPLVRIYAEAPDIETTRKMLQFGKEMMFK